MSQMHKKRCSQVLADRASKPRTLIKRFIFIIRDTKWKSKGVISYESRIRRIKERNEKDSKKDIDFNSYCVFWSVEPFVAYS